MRLRDLIEHLRAHGCRQLRHGAKHDHWHNPLTNAVTSVPRHREIPLGTIRAICRDLGIAFPTKR